MTLTVSDSDYRKQHKCVFLAPSLKPGDITRTFTVIGTFKGSDQVECPIPLDFPLLGDLFLTLLVNNDYYSNFVPFKTFELADIVDISPAYIHGSIASQDLVLTFTGGRLLPSQLYLQIDNAYYQAALVSSHYANNT